MNDKYSPAKCAQYGRRLAARLVAQHFAANPTATLDGPALLTFTPIRQINLLVLRQLLTQWQAEAARLQSPFFAFDAAPVQAALGQLMNVLSRHIRLDRAALEPLLAQAVADTLGIVADPVGSFQRLLLPGDPAPTLAALRDNLRYFDLDKAFYQGFLDVLPSTAELTPDFVQHRFELYHAANYKAHQPMQRLVSDLSALLPLTTADLLEDGPVSPTATPAPTATPIPAVASVPVPVAPPRPAAPATPSPAPVQKPDTSSVVFEPAAVPVPPPAVAPTPNDAPIIPLHEKLKATQSASPLAETLRASSPAPKNAHSGAPKVETLREAISINQRFSFINELFEGENMEYHAAIQHLDSLPTAEEARAYVSGPLSQRHDWSRKEEHVNKLLKLIERKFA